MSTLTTSSVVVSPSIPVVAPKLPTHTGAARKPSKAKPLSQLAFEWDEVPSKSAAASVSIPIGVEAKGEPSIIKFPTNVQTARRGKTEHISDLLLVVLDRYGIDAEEFVSGLHD